jgi:hypothetical protein
MARAWQHQFGKAGETAAVVVIAIIGIEREKRMDRLNVRLQTDRWMDKWRGGHAVA